MLIRFTDKGCMDCPFFHSNSVVCHWCCLNRRKDRSEKKSKFKIDFCDKDYVKYVDELGLDPGDRKHKNCPFVAGNEVTIIAKSKK
jgi:hypothetical protein